MKKLVFILVSLNILFLHAQTYLENFDTASNWSGGAMNSYNSKTYELPSPQHNDKFTSDQAVREGSNTHSGAYAWRLKKASNVYLRYECEGTVSGFSIYAARWDNSPKPNVTVRYSTDSGTNYTTAFTFTGDDFTGDKVYKQFSYTFSSPITNEPGKKIFIEFVTTSGERMLYDDFSIDFVTSSGPQITNITHTPDPVTPSDNVNVSADVTDPDGINSVELHWGTASGNLTNTISMSNTSGDTYTTVSAIPAQPDGTTVYYEIYAEDNNNDATTSPEQSYTVTSSNTTACASELIISEYVEGSGNNKYLEIFNGTGGAVNMSDYQIRIYGNGNSSPTSRISLNTHTLNPGEVYIIAHTDADVWTGTPDQTSGALAYNGDDAIELYNMATGQSVDIIGQIGVDPGSAWGSGNTSTKDHTLRRKPEITQGDTDGSDPFDPADEWDGYDIDVVDGLGSHTMICGPRLIVSADTLSGFNYVEGYGPSASQNFTLSGSNLDGSDVTLSAPADYEISEDNTNFVASITLASYDGTDKTVYVRLKAGLSAGDYNNETVTIGGGGDPDGEEVVLNGTVEAANPEIVVEGNNIEIPDGDTTPDTADGTDFGNVEAANGSLTHTFVIKNTGNADLTVNGISSDNGVFTVGGTTSGTVAPGDSLSFTVTFAPDTVGTLSAVISVENNDADENPYDFTVQGTGTYSTASDIVENGGFTYTSNIEYLNYQGDPITNTSHSVGVFKFDIRDGGASGDADDKPTVLTSITFSLANPAHGEFIRNAALFDGNAMKNNTPVMDRTAGTITFSGLSGEDFTAPDDGVKSLTLRVSFTSDVTDNEQMQFIVTSAEADTNGSVFAQPDAGGARSSITGDRNRIEVIADRIRFTVQPQDGAVDTPLEPFTVAAVDTNYVKDLDAANQVSLSTSGTDMVHNSPYTMTDGEVTFTDVKFTSPQTNITITASTTGLAVDNDDVSQAFDISEVPDGSYRTVSDGTWKSTDGGTAQWEQFINGAWQEMTDQPPTDTDKPVFIRDSIVLVGTNSARDIRIEDGGFLNTNGVSQTLTKLLVQNGGTYYKNSNGIRVVDTGYIEVKDGGTFIFKHTNGTELTGNIWNGTEKFHPNSNFVVEETDNESNDLFMETAAEVSSFMGGQFGNVIIDMADGKLLLLPDNYNDTLAKGNLIFKHLADNAKLTNTDASCTILGNLELQSGLDQDITVTLREVDVQLTVKGDFIHRGSEDFRLANSSSSNPDVIMRVEGDLILENTAKLRPDISSNGTGDNKIELAGDLRVGPDALLYSENENTELHFVGQGDGLTDETIQTISIASTDDANENKNIDFVVNEGAYVRLADQDLELGKNGYVRVREGAVFDFGFNGNTALTVTKSGTQTGTGFDLDAGGYLVITSPDGIWSDSSRGNVQVVASNTTFSPLATFHYTGKQNQITGDAIGSSSNGRAIIVELANDSLSLTPTQSFGITDAENTYINNGNGGILDIRKGQFVETADAYVTGSTGGLRMADGTRYVIASNSADSDDYLPRLEGAYDLQGASTIELAGDGDKILRGSRAYRNLTFSNAGTTTLSSAVTSITGEVYITDNATLDVENRTFGGDNTDLRMDANAMYRTAGTGTKPDASGNYDLSQNSAIVFTQNGGNGWQRIRLSKTYQHIIIEGDNVGNYSETGSISFHDGGSFTVLPGAVFKLKNTNGFAGSDSTALNTSNNPRLDLQAGSTIDYAGADQYITPAPYSNLRLSESGVKKLAAESVGVNDTLEVDGVTLLIENDRSLIVGKHVANAGIVEVDHSGSLVQTAENATLSLGDYRLYKNVTGLQHYYDYVFVSTPLESSAFTFDDLMPNAWARYRFDATRQDSTQYPDPAWVPVAGDDTLTPGIGYAVSMPQDFAGGDIRLAYTDSAGKFNTGNIEVEVNEGVNQSWNLLGNPYPSALDFNAFAADNPAIEGFYAAWTNCKGLDSTGRHQKEGYTLYSTGSGSVRACETGLQAGRYINTAQAFFVLSNQNPATVMFKNSQRVAGHNNLYIYAPEETSRLWVNIKSEDGSVFRQLLIGFFENATEGRDRNYDVPAMRMPDLWFYSLGGGNKYVIQGLPAWDGNERRISLGITATAAGRYSLYLDRTEGQLRTIPVYLYDREQNRYYDLRRETVRINVAEGSTDNRYELVLNPQFLRTDQDTREVRLTGHEGIFTLQSAQPVSGVEVFDLNGRLIATAGPSRNGTVVIDLRRKPHGVYVWVIRWNDGVSLHKKVIR